MPNNNVLTESQRMDLLLVADDMSVSGDAKLAEALRTLLATHPGQPEPISARDPLTDIAHQLWSAALLAPGEGIEDAARRIEAILVDQFGARTHGQPEPRAEVTDKGDAE